MAKAKSETAAKTDSINTKPEETKDAAAQTPSGQEGQTGVPAEGSAAPEGQTPPAGNGEGENKDPAAGPAAGDQGEGGGNEGTDGAGNPGQTPDGTQEPAKEETLLSLEVLAGDFRVPSWQVAALHRMMGWEKGKKVSKKDYAAGLESLKNRPLGV